MDRSIPTLEEIMHHKHLILMVLGCALPIAALAAVFLFHIELSTPVLFALILLGPLSHLLMLGGHKHDRHPADHSTRREIEHG